MENSRIIAFNALLKIEKDSAFSNLVLDSFLSKAKLDTRDKSFVSALFYGVIERQLTIDYQLVQYLSKPLKKLKPEVLVILRLGTYQILFMDKIPTSAAVNECVKISKKVGCSFASGLINAVLRKVASSGLKLPSDKASSEYLSVLYSCPSWLVEKWIDEYGFEDTIGILESTCKGAKTFIRVNTEKTTPDELIEILALEKVSAEKTYIENALKISLNGNDVENLQSFKDGLFHVQDLASQICISVLAPRENDVVFDLCSAPGGKAYTIAQLMKNKGIVNCFDLYEHRTKLILNGAKRLSLSVIKAQAADASVYNEALGFADKVLCDVPCSGLGIIRRKPEIKYKKAQDFKTLPEIQYSIICNASRYVKVGGVLVYSTCTLSKDENENVCDRFILSHPEFKIKEQNGKKYRTLMPHKDESDGFFIACFERVV